ncbi:5-formyltetrahydrofolate cyclo-ligase [Cellulophaga baltica]|uniref:5-formyltetrahydrofolate cyclo-ligase n=1 Tax=Cellulophaga TaxID=104264 RepID=UPI001C06AC23|nr:MULTISPECIES: 5-formyltetrahydrofolate cyclo-ligase [Cellulophaga]MBU2995694.1 5-formyltetrahydrofolate cyclo-ligase [Cellulophaga baltica]MDO6767088.1 5-formyltetrahydrofolate cyclo-ligase [Cellulophaga sp. 1_MG-2023]
MNKKDLRIHYTKRRKILSSDQISDLSLDISNQILQLPIWNLSYYHIFLSIVEKKEVDTNYILSILQGKDKNVILSKMINPHELQHFLLTDSTLIKTNKWNVPEPVEGIEIETKKIEVVFIPLLAFDRSGNRVGYGKGYYDRFLNACNNDVIKIGLSFFEATDCIDDILPTDIPLNYCVTPKEIYSF